MKTTPVVQEVKDAASEDWERDAIALAEAHALAADVPAAWIKAAASELPVEAAFPAYRFSASEIEEARELFGPLDPKVKEKIVERTVDAFLREAPRPTSAPGVEPRGRWGGGRRWLTRLGPPLATAAAAASLTFVLTRSAAPEHGELAGHVRATSADRAPGETSLLTLESGSSFLLDCRVEGRSIEVVNVRAERSGAAAQEARGLGWTVVAEADDGATLHVTADLPPGTWQVACDVYEASSGRLSHLAPPASLVIER